MHLSPNASSQGESLDFTIVRKDNLFSIFTQLHKLFNGKIASATFVEKVSGRELSFRAESPLCVQADGEFVGETKNLSFSISPVRVKVLV
jgi:diacylglycerol kinase family enzyme